jgi:hypothetical protein
MVNDFQNKLVAVLNKSINTGKLMNALAHMCIGLGSDIGQPPLRLTHYKDADGGSHRNIRDPVHYINGQFKQDSAAT